MTDRARAFDVVAQFEAALCEFTGAPYAVTVDSCTNAIFLALKCNDDRYWKLRSHIEVRRTPTVELPNHTYVGVVQAARNAGYRVTLVDRKWTSFYSLSPTRVVDSAKFFERGMYVPGDLTCVSFQAGKLLPIGRGGAILTDDEDAASWLRRARLDGRTGGADYHDATFQTPGFHCYMAPPDAARGLWLLTYLEDDDKADWTEYPDLSKATWS